MTGPAVCSGPGTGNAAPPFYVDVVVDLIVQVDVDVDGDVDVDPTVVEPVDTAASQTRNQAV